jgi:hypothetical protein
MTVMKRTYYDVVKFVILNLFLNFVLSDGMFEKEPEGRFRATFRIINSDNVRRFFET